MILRISTSKRKGVRFSDFFHGKNEAWPSSLLYCTHKNCRFCRYGINTQMSLEKIYWILQAMDSVFVSKRALKELPNAFMSLS